MLLPTTAMVALLSPLVGRYVDKYGPKFSLIVGFAFFVLSAFIQTQFTGNSSLGVIVTAFVLMGVGWGCILRPSTVASLSSIPESMGAVAMGSAWTIHNIGGVIGLGLGLVIYRMFAKMALLNVLHNENSLWLKTMIDNPDNAMTILQHHTHLTASESLSVFEQFFMSGYQAAMWLLVATSFIVLMVMLFGYKK